MPEEPAGTVRLQSGDPAPDFELPDESGQLVRLSEMAGSWVLVYFYPKDSTPGCTTEACDFQHRLDDLTGLGVRLVGISGDGAESHRRFRTRYGLSFALLSDEGHEVMARYGAYGPKMNYGRAVVGVIRSTFLIDPAGRIVRAWYGVKATGHAERVMKEVAAAVGEGE